MANYHGAPIVKPLFLLIVALALAGCSADKPEPLSEIYRLDLGPGMVAAFAVRAYWLESGELSRGIMTDPVATLLVRERRATDPESPSDWPPGWDWHT